MTDDTGIYAIENLRELKAYVGATRQGFLRRWTEHRWFLLRGQHYNLGLQEDWQSYGPGWFACVPLEILARDVPFALREQHWIDRLQHEGFLCYNRVPAAECPDRENDESYSPMPREVYGIQEIARTLRVSDRTMRQLLQSGVVHGYKLGGVWRIPHAELQRLRAPKATPESDELPDTPYGECS